jgi:hypothetical protein
LGKKMKKSEKSLFRKTPAGRAARGAQACQRLDNAGFDRLLLSGCSAGFCLELLFWRCRPPANLRAPRRPAGAFTDKSRQI